MLRMGMVVFVLSSASLASAQSYRGPTRADFDERLIRGQTSKAGSVYIYDRQEIDIKSLVRRARSFKQKIIRTVFERE
ncbi:MAG: hypothetical protein HYZ27_07230 [Deltaproteobacteria bacterium]|nr:hypothetical protein [Deltaproteobacteria bacterium]